MLSLDVVLCSHSFFCSLDGVLYGPMHSQQGVELYKQAIKDAQAQGGKVEFGGKVSQHLLSA